MGLDDLLVEHVHASPPPLQRFCSAPSKVRIDDISLELQMGLDKLLIEHAQVIPSYPSACPAPALSLL